MNWKLKRRLAKIFQYEYWPFMVFFLPLVPLWLYYTLRNRSLVYFTAVNPGIYLSGLFGESKREILEKIAPQYLPVTLYFEEGVQEERINKALNDYHLSYPFILKPDVGERGNDVEKIESQQQLKRYLQEHKSQKTILQEFVGYEYEFGVFYYKYPNGGSGISSITGKKFLSVTGDGKSTLAELIQSDTRASMQFERLSIKYKDQINSVLRNKYELLLEPIGNHCKGTMFLDRTSLATTALLQTFDHIAEGYEGFYFGRFDLKVKSLDSFSMGKDIKIMELNGVTSEPAHVYDPNYKLWKAYRDIAKNMDICARIARQNHKNGVPYLKAKDIFIYLKNYFNKNDNNTQPSPELVLDYAHH